MTATRRLQPPSENPSWQPDRFTNHSCTAHCASCAIQAQLLPERRSVPVWNTASKDGLAPIWCGGQSVLLCSVSLPRPLLEIWKDLFRAWTAASIRMPGPLRTPRRPPPKTTGPLALVYTCASPTVTAEARSPYRRKVDTTSPITQLSRFDRLGATDTDLSVSP